MDNRGPGHEVVTRCKGMVRDDGEMHETDGRG